MKPEHRNLITGTQGILAAIDPVGAHEAISASAEALLTTVEGRSDVDAGGFEADAAQRPVGGGVRPQD